MRSKYPTHIEPNLKKIAQWRRSGYREDQIRARLNVGHTAWHKYKNEHKEFADALKESTDNLVMDIEESLFMQAKKGNMTAIIFTLKNLAPNKWTDVKKIQADINGGLTLVQALENVNGDKF